MYLIADNLHVIHPPIAEAMKQMDAGPIQALVSRCQKAGAHAIDVNSGPLPKAPEMHFEFLVDAVQGATDLPLFLDTTNPVALEAGLQHCNQKVVINGFSLEPAKIAHMLPLAKLYDADIIGYLLDAKSRVPIEEEALMALAVELLEVYLAADLDPDRLIIDPVVAPLSWDKGREHNQAVLSLLQNLPELLGMGVRTIAGLSNLASGPMPPSRKIALEQAYLPMLAAAGLDMVLLNVFHEPTMQTAKMCDALLSDKVLAWEDVPTLKG